MLELIAFRLIPVVCPARSSKPENVWRRSLIPDRAYPAIESLVVISQGAQFSKHFGNFRHGERRKIAKKLAASTPSDAVELELSGLKNANAKRRVFLTQPT